MSTMMPIFTTPAGRCLTAKNWREAGVQRACFYLEALLVKPGLAYLKTLPDWTMYSGWDGDWVLNASLPTPNSEGQYVICSPYDGARVSCSMQDIVDIVLHLKPQGVILPEGQDVGELATVTQILSVTDDNAIASNAPAEDACQGIVYGSEGDIHLRNKIYSTQFEPIDSQCHCPSCEQSLTRAYLHHLLEHTPLLCHRFLIQHNLYYKYKSGG